MNDLPKPSPLQIWLVGTRPFALPASVMPVLFGTAAAVSAGGAAFHAGLFFAALLGMAFLHSGANLMNDVYDYKKGIDANVNPVSGAVVRGWLTPRQALTGAWIFLSMGSLLGLWIVTQTSLLILYIGIIGLIIGISYTCGPWPLKFNAIGDLAVFFSFGILGALGAWTVQTGQLSWTPVLWSVPMSLLVIGILHANNWRDIQNDTNAHIKTIASLLGDQGSKPYYQFLLFSPFACIAILLILTRLTVLQTMPLTFLITLLALPRAIQLDKISELRKDSDNIQKFLALDGSTAQLNMLFGLLCTIAAILSRWFA